MLRCARNDGVRGYPALCRWVAFVSNDPGWVKTALPHFETRRASERIGAVRKNDCVICSVYRLPIVHSQEARQVAVRYINAVFIMAHPQRLGLMQSVFGKKTAP